MPDGTEITAIDLGDTYRDTVTGFKGKVVGRADYLTGCAQALLTANVRGRVESLWFDYPRLQFIIEAAETDIAHEPAVRRSGGPTPVAAHAAPRPS